MTLIAQTLSSLTLGPPTRVHNLTLVPLLGEQDPEPRYLTLGDALKDGAIEVTEVSQAGSVPSLKARNQGDRAVLILDGEELVGAKQDRVVNLTIMVPARAELTIPVSCVEQGRWSARHGVRFKASKQTMHARGRRRNTRMVTGSLLHEGNFRGDQGAVWREVDEKVRRMKAESLTGALGHAYSRYEIPLDDYSAGFRPLRGQRGAVFAVNGRVEGLELFDSPATWARVEAKLCRSYALDAIERRQDDRRQTELSAGEVEAFLTLLSETPVLTFPGVGIGHTIRFQTSDVVGAGLVQDDTLIHLSAFSTVD
jgi:hypothetical protein